MKQRKGLATHMLLDGCPDVDLRQVIVALPRGPIFWRDHLQRKRIQAIT